MTYSEYRILTPLQRDKTAPANPIEHHRRSARIGIQPSTTDRESLQAVREARSRIEKITHWRGWSVAAALETPRCTKLPAIARGNDFNTARTIPDSIGATSD